MLKKSPIQPQNLSRPNQIELLTQAVRSLQANHQMLVSQIIDFIKKEVGQRATQGPPGPRGPAGISPPPVDEAALYKKLHGGVLQAIPIPKDGEDGQDGKDGTSVNMEEVASLVMSMIEIPEPKVPTVEEILAEVQKELSVDKIKGLREKMDEVRRAAALGGGMRGGGDTVKAGSGISISRDVDGKTVINNTGTSANKIFGEQVTFSGGAGTLAHTPTVGTVRLHRGGAYQQAGAGKDYTISGANMTLAVNEQSEEIFLADYEY